MKYFVLLLLIPFAVAVAPGELCSPFNDECPEGTYCSGQKNAFQMTRCCPDGSEFNFYTNECYFQCIDADGDGYGVHCDLGEDCDDTNPQIIGGKCRAEVAGEPTEAKRTEPRQPNNERVPQENTFANRRFLTYPLESTDDNYILSGWYRGSGAVHRGQDYVPDEDKTYYIVAAADGVVDSTHYYTGQDNRLNGDDLGTCIASDRTLAYGNRIMINQDNGLTTVYAHFKKGSILVNKSQYVQRGQRLGIMGSTGCSTGNHLHFELRNGTTKLDPYDIYGYPAAYPDRISPNATCGSNHFWTQCPPVVHSTPRETVRNKVAPSCTASPEICDGKDNDCDGVEDDGVSCALQCGKCGDGFFNLCDEEECTHIPLPQFVLAFIPFWT